jgi:hypothetical protein
MSRGFIKLLQLTMISTIIINFQVLEIHGNPISLLQDDVFIHCNLLNLQEIVISHCQLHTVERYAFRDLINMVKLDLDNNQLTSVPSSSFPFITDLRELKLAFNTLQRLENYAFSVLSDLVKLDLSHCSLTSIEPRAFSGLDSLQWLSLDHNSLTVLHPTALLPLKTIHGLNLHSNPWNCSCGLRPIRDWMKANNVPASIPPICAQPSRVEKRSWDSLGLDDFACPPVVVSQAKIIVKKATSPSGHWFVTLQCQIEANPAAVVSWTWQGHVIVNGSQSSGLGQAKFIMSEWGNRLKVSNLTILNAEVDHGGIFACQGQNKAGLVESKATLVLAKPVMTTTLHKRSESKTGNNETRSQIYVIAAFGGGLVIFVTLFVACCVFSMTQRSSFASRPKCFRPSPSQTMAEAESLRNSQYDANEVTELTHLHENAVTSSQAAFVSKTVTTDEGYKSMSSYSVSTPSSVTSPPQRPPSPPDFGPPDYGPTDFRPPEGHYSPPRRLPSPQRRPMSPQQQRKLPSPAQSPPPLFPRNALTSSPASQTRSLLRPDRHLRRPAQRPLSDNFTELSSPRVRFNLEPMHFQISEDEAEVSIEDLRPLKFRDRSPSDPLISFSATLDEQTSRQVDSCHLSRGLQKLSLGPSFLFLFISLY